MGGARRGLLACAVAICGIALIAPAANADSSANVSRVSALPLVKGAISINFIGETMFVSTVGGLYSYDVSDPAHPRRLDVLAMPVWENEDVDVDPVRKRVFISRDPRGFVSPAAPSGLFPYGAVHIIDVSDPSRMRQLKAFLLPAGHTTTCVNGCDYIWTAGPLASTLTQPARWGGRPIFATDVRNPYRPVACPEPIDTGRNDGATDYVHDVQVDARGVAWVSGRGGVRGYWTSGRHRNPLSGRIEQASGCRPIPAGGGGSSQTVTTSRFMHNSWRNVDAALRPGARGRRAGRGRVLYATEENITSDCKTSGKLVTYDLRGTLDGEGFRAIDRSHFRMRVLDSWTPESQPGSTGCASAHYFTDRGDGILAQAFYEQGVRFLDVSNPRDIRQVGWWRSDDSDTWAAYWHRGLVYVADFQRGVEVLRFDGAPGRVRRVRAPLAARRGALRMDPQLGYLCPLRAPSPSA